MGGGGGCDRWQMYGGAWQERGGGVFERGLIPWCTLCSAKCRVEPESIKSNDDIVSWLSIVQNITPSFESVSYNLHASIWMALRKRGGYLFNLLQRGYPERGGDTLILFDHPWLAGLPKKQGWGRGWRVWQEKGGDIFEFWGGVHTPIHTVIKTYVTVLSFFFFFTNICKTSRFNIFPFKTSFPSGCSVLYEQKKFTFPLMPKSPIDWTAKFNIF